MKTCFKTAALASFAALVPLNIASAAPPDRMAAVEECVDLARSQVPPPAATVRDSATMRARTNVYTACMRRKGLRP
jgi:hypothetical protein